MNYMHVAAVALAYVAVPAAAAEIRAVGDTAVILHYGQWVVAVAQMATDILVPLLTAVIMGVIAKFYPLARMVITETLVETTLQKWFDFGVNATAGAVRDETVSVPVGSRIVAAGLNRAAERANASSVSAWVFKQAGGPKEIAHKLFRKLKLEEGATAARVIEPALRDAPVPMSDR